MDEVDVVIELAHEIASLRSQLAEKEALLGSMMGRRPSKAPRARAVRSTRALSEGTVTAAIVLALKRSEAGLRIPEIARAVGSNADSVGTMLRRLLARGYVVRTHKGQYRAS